VSVTDPNTYIVRSSEDPATIWERMEDTLFGSSLGGYVLPRYDEENDVHYIDYLALDENDQYAHTSTQVVRFGENLLSFAKTSNASNIVTALIPYGAEIEDSQDPEYDPVPPTPTLDTVEHWDGNRRTIMDANNGRRWIDHSAGQAIWGRIVGTKVWDDVTLATNLLTKATAWLNQQVYANLTLEISAVDLSFVDADIEQIQVGDYVRVESKPHDLNALLLCSSKTTVLTNLAESVIVLGVGLKSISDLQAGK
jgi:hypothetical protein